MNTFPVLRVAKTLCEKKNWGISNLELNKLLYLAHMLQLGRTEGQVPLISNAFEAWDYGPVSPRLYHKAKVFGSKSVGNIFHQYDEVDDDGSNEILQEIIRETADMSPGQLVAETHWEDGAWYKNYEPGMMGVIIPNADILEEYYKRVRHPEHT